MTIDIYKGVARQKLTLMHYAVRTLEPGPAPEYRGTKNCRLWQQNLKGEWRILQTYFLRSLLKRLLISANIFISRVLTGRDTKLFSPLKVNRRFGETCCLNIQGRRIKPSKKPAWKQVISRALLILRAWKWRQYVPPKSRLTFNGLCGVKSRR
jgi:hypothetical protein